VLGSAYLNKHARRGRGGTPIAPAAGTPAAAVPAAAISD